MREAPMDGNGELYDTTMCQAGMRPPNWVFVQGAELGAPT